MTQTIASTSDYAARIAKVRAAMVSKQVDAALLSVGHDLPYLSGYFAMPLERLTMLVIPQSGEVTMVVPRLEVARVTPQPGVFDHGVGKPKILWQLLPSCWVVQSRLRLAIKCGPDF